LLIVDGGVKKEELESLRNLNVDIAVQGGAIFAK
jgi:pentose-5-phosphate-3-epimerase